MALTYSDFTPGRVFKLGPRLVTEAEIVEFSTAFDPQPFHLDPSSPQAELVGGIIASGWQTCSIFMRMMCDAYLLNSTSLGSAGLDEIRWLKPVRPGDTLSGTATVEKSRVSASRPGLGLVSFLYELHNQNDETVMTVTGMGMFAVEKTS